MSKDYKQTGIGSPVEVTKGGPLVRNNAGVLENRNNADSAFSIMRGAPAVGNDDFATLAQIGGGGGEVNTASNIGVGTGVFSAKVLADLEFKSLTSTGNTVTITDTLTTVNVESASDAVTSSTFTDTAGIPLEFTLAAVASVSQVISRVSTRNTVTGASVSYEIIVTSDGTTISGSTDIVQVDGPTPLTTLALSVVDNAGNINLRFARTGGGDNIQLHYASSTLPI